METVEISCGESFEIVLNALVGKRSLGTAAPFPPFICVAREMPKKYSFASQRFTLDVRNSGSVCVVFFTRLLLLCESFADVLGNPSFS